MEIDRITGQVVDAALDVHTALGPGLLEATYEACLFAELERRELTVGRQVGLPVLYRGERIDLGYRIDLLVQEEVIVEVKAITKLQDVHRAQLLSYLRLSGRRFGLLLNFHVPHMRDGIVRMVNGW